MSTALQSVRLECGTALAYADGWSPRPGDLVPCPRHGYCDVRENTHSPEPPTQRRKRRPARTRAELLEFVASRQMVSVPTLLRHRFRLRLLYSAAFDGLIEFDEDDLVRIKGHVRGM